MPYNSNTGTYSYNVGDLVRLQATFKDLASVLADPTTVVLKVKNPAGTTTTYNYPGTIIRSSTGVFYYDYLVGASGTHYFNFAGAGAYTAVDESSFEVVATQF
jgi:hypothetical protein